MGKIHIRITIFLSIILISLSCSKTPEELKYVEQLMEHRPDSALILLKQSSLNQFIQRSDKALYALLLSQAYDKNNELIETDSLISVATGYFDQKEPVHAAYAWFYQSRCARNRNDAKTQAQNLLKAMEYAQMTDNNKLKALISSDAANMYELQSETDSALFYEKKSYYWFRQEKDFVNLAISASNIGNLFSKNDQYDSAIHYLKIAEKIAIPLKSDLLQCTIYKTFGNASYRKKDYHTAIEYYHKAPLTRIPIYDNNKWYLLATCYTKAEKYDSAQYYLRKITDIAPTSLECYKLWQIIYEKKNNYQNALLYSKKIIAGKDSVYQMRLDESFAGLNKKYNYEKLSLQNKILQLENKQKSITILVVLLILSTIMFLFLSWRFRSKKREVEILKQLNEREKALREKANENNILLSNQTKMQKILLQNFEEYKSKALKEKKFMKSEAGNSEEVQDEIIKYIDTVFPGFSARLTQTFAQLTKRDVFICCMLLGGFDTGTIATILEIRNDSMHIQRSRLRKKLNLETNVNLVDFLQNFQS